MSGRQALALVIDDSALHRRFAARVLEHAGWRVVAAEGAAAGLALAETEAPDLILLDVQMEGVDGWQAIARLREGDGAGARVPVIAFTTQRGITPDRLAEAGFDSLLAKPTTAEAMIAAVARHHPRTALAGPMRLEELFGAEALAGLLRGFRDELTQALAALDGGDAPARSHRIAGIAGTLGFPQVSDSWLAVSEGDRRALPRARRDALRALAMLDDLGLPEGAPPH